MKKSLIELENLYILKNVLPKVFNKREIKYSNNSARLYKWVKKHNMCISEFVYDKAFISSERFENGETEFKLYTQTDNKGNWEYTKCLDENGNTFNTYTFVSPIIYFYVVCGDNLYVYKLTKLNKINDSNGFNLTTDEAYRVINIKKIRKEFKEKFNYINELPKHLCNREIINLMDKIK